MPVEVDDIEVCLSRRSILGHESATQFSNLGLVQVRHGYDPDLLATILRKALAIKADRAIHRHLDLTYIPNVDAHIPEVKDLLHDKNRLDRLSTLAGTRLEPYPISVIGATITFMDAGDDGTLTWHNDGVPATELIPLEISDPIIGGELEVYCGVCEDGMARVARNETLPSDRCVRLQHKMGLSTLGQLHGICHRTNPVRYGHRVTLNLNSWSAEKAHIDNNTLTYLAADNGNDPKAPWVAKYVELALGPQLAAYQASQRGHEPASHMTPQQVQAAE